MLFLQFAWYAVVYRGIPWSLKWCPSQGTPLVGTWNCCCPGGFHCLMRWSKPPSKPAFDTCDMVKFKWWMFNHYIKSWDFIWDMNGVFLGVYNQSEFGWYTHFFGCSSILIGMCIPIILENPFMMVGWPHHILGRHTECVLHWWRTKGCGWSFPYVYRHKACKNSRQNPTASSSPTLQNWMIYN